MSLSLEKLEAKVDQLIHHCDQLQSDNQILRDDKTKLISDHAALLKKTTLARTRIEAMIGRLKKMEAETEI